MTIRYVAETIIEGVPVAAGMACLALGPLALSWVIHALATIEAWPWCLG